VIDAPIKQKNDVQAGDLLYRIDPLPYKLELEKAKATLLKDQAELEFAKKKVERYETLVKKDFVSKLTLEEYQRDVKALEAQIEIDRSLLGTAANNLNYSKIYSPINGRVSLQSIEIGNLVAPSDTNPMATILQIVPIDVNFSIAQKDFEELQHVLAEGKRAFRAILPGTNQKFLGEISAIDNRVDLQTGTIQIKGSIQNTEKILWPGEFVRVEVFIRQLKDAVLIPYKAIQVGQEGSYIYILQPDQTVKNIPIEMGQRVGDWIAITKGVEQGMQVVTDGQINLRPGAKVVVANGKEDQNP
jgi:multidrug efflux system membrane fusion protein